MFFVDLECGGQLKGPTGVINSLDFVSDFSSNNICTWNVTVLPGRTILVKFPILGLLFNSCTVSYVMVRIYFNLIVTELFLINIE